MRQGVNADAHAEFISGSVDGSVKDVLWKATFVKGKGYAHFAERWYRLKTATDCH
jgi:hypothetical protein